MAWATWSKVDKHSEIVISGTKNEVIDNSTSSARGCRSGHFHNTGKIYVEMVFTDIISTGYLNEIGIATSGASLNTIAGASAVAWVCDITSGNLRKVNNNSGTDIITGSYGDGTILMIAVDLTNGKVWFGADGTWSGDPAAGTGEAYSSASISGNDIFLIGSVTNTTTAAMTSDPDDHTYSAPSGFTAGWGSTPTGVAEWNPSDTNLEIDISGTNNTIIDGTTGSARGSRSDLAFSTGKKYVEFIFTDVTTTGFLLELGIATDAASLNTIAGASAVAWVADITSGDLRKVNNNSGTVIISGSYGDGDILMVAVDLGAGKVWFGINGTWSGDPGAGTGEAYSSASISGNDIYLMGSVNSSTTGEMVPDAGDMTYSAPSGFTAGWGSAGGNVFEVGITGAVGAGESLGDNMGLILGAAGLNEVIDAFRDRSPIEGNVDMKAILSAFIENETFIEAVNVKGYVEAFKEMALAFSAGVEVNEIIAAFREIEISVAAAAGMGSNFEVFNYSSFVRDQGTDFAKTYHFKLTGGNDGLDDAIIPMISASSYSRQSAPTNSAVVVPYEYLSQVVARQNGEMVVDMAFMVNGVEVNRENVFTVDFDSYSYAKTRPSQTITIYGSRSETFVAKDIQLENITYDSYTQGRIRYRADIDPYLKPGDTVNAGTIDFTAGLVSLTINKVNQIMEVAES